MNCANHPDIPIAAYCQFCGKPVCDQCVRKVNNIVSCEPCLAARIGAAPTSSAGGGARYVQTPDGIHVSDGKGNEYTSGPGYQYISSAPGAAGTMPSWGTNPWVAFGLGWIPGVGAMYNGQFAKALAHVVIFALLVDFSHYNGALGILCFFWIVYQVFDAYQTAIARRDGLPLPNPLGLNDVAHWFGLRNAPPTNPWVNRPPFTGGENPPSAAEVPPVGTTGPVQGFAPASEYVPPYAPYVPPVPPIQPDPFNSFGNNSPVGANHGIHAGAVVLIVLGLAFLLGNLGILSEHWMNRGWPIVLIGIGVWMVIRHSQKPPMGGAR